MILAAVLIGAIALSDAAAPDACTDLSSHDLETLARFQFAQNTRVDSAELPVSRAVRVGKVRVVRQPIFDADNPAEDRWLYRAADALHMDTRESVIRRVVLFSEGERVEVTDLVESERILRQKPYLYDARVLPRRLCGDVLDVDIVTRDVWTLNPRVELSRSGGDDSFGIGLTDANIFGTGSELSAGYSADEDRKGVDLFYYDPNVAGSRVSLTGFFSDNDDGDRQYVDVRHPFYALDVPYSIGALVDFVDEEDGLYFRNREFAEFRRQVRHIGASGGISLGRRDAHVRRLLMGYRVEDHEFAPLPGRPAPLPFPQDRRFGYPFIGFESVEDEYAVAVNVDRIQRTEDLFVGERVLVELGYSNGTLGGDEARRAVFRLSYQDTKYAIGRDLLKFGANARGYWNFDADEEEEFVARAFADYRRRQGERFSFAAALSVTYTSNLFADQQLLLGGETGLRGYPSRYQWGDRSFVLNLEERYFSDVYLWRLIRLGYAAFIDVGRAWFPGDPDSDAYGVLANVGVGLRLESTRTRRDRLYHIDVGVPLVDGVDADAVQLSFTVKSQL